MSAVNFTDAEWSTIANGLRVAAERYAEHARALEDGSDAGPSFQRMADQFRRQVAEARALADRICDEVGV